MFRVPVEKFDSSRPGPTGGVEAATVALEDFSILIVAGESSGERHAAGLVKELNGRYPNRKIQWFGSGGERMAAVGVDLFLDVSALGAIGPWEALPRMGNYWRLYRKIFRETQRRKPRLAILVDFPEFNLRLLRRLKALAVPVCYFVGPQVWAWRSSRVNLIRRYVDLMLVILPFEEPFYRRCGVRAYYVGNPLGGALTEPAAPCNDPPLLALLPGSRQKEVEQIFPVQLDAARYIEDRHCARFWVIQAPAVRREDLEIQYQQWLRRGNSPLHLEIRGEGTDRLLPRVDCAIVKSGTSTLEAMRFQVPFAMVYRVSTPTWYLLRPFVHTDCYCLANLVAGDRIVPEFVQGDATGEKVGAYLVRLLRDKEQREKIREKLRLASGKMGERNAYLESARMVQSQILKD